MISHRVRTNFASASLGAIAALLSTSPAAAQQQNACGDLVDGEVSCPAGEASYDQGIRYDAFGDITLNLGDGLALAPETGFAGIIAVSDVDAHGSVTIDGATTSIVTRDAIGAVVEAEGDVLIDLSSVSTEATTPGEIAAGIFAASTFGSITVNAGSVETVGDNSRGIVVENGGAGAIQINAGSISTNGFGSGGVAVIAGGRTEIRVEEIAGRGDNIWGLNIANGIYSQDELETDDSFLNIGRIDLSGTSNAGVMLSSYSNAHIAIEQLNIEGFGSTGVNAVAQGSVRVEVGQARFKGEQTGGIFAQGGLGDAIVKVGSVTSESGGGASALSTQGWAIVEAGSIHVSGDSALGAQAASTNGNAVVRVDDVSTNGLFAPAVSVEAWVGTISVVAGTLAAEGDGSYGVFAYGKTNLIQVNGSLTTSGERGVGILSSTTHGDNLVFVRGDLSTQGSAAEGLWVTGRYGTAGIRTSGAISTVGDQSAGIRATGEDGQVVIEAQTVTTGGAHANGIHARTRFIEPYLGYFPGDPVAFTGNIDIRAANVTVTGEGSTGISARGIGNAAILAGDVTARSGPAIETDMIGTVSLDLRGTVRSDGANAISAKGADVSIDIAAGARIFGGPDGLVVHAMGQRCVMRPPSDGSPNPCPNPGNDEFGEGTGFRTGPASLAPLAGFDGSAHIVNRGTIEAGDGFAVRVDTGAVTIENHGMLRGAVQFAGGNDQFDNAGLFLFDKDSDFGAGIDILRNQGTLRLAGGQVRLEGLDRLENGGLIDLANGMAGDTLTVSGDYVGRAGALVRLDIDGASLTADRLVIEGKASGSTLVALGANPVEAKLTGIGGVVLVEVRGGSDAGAFTLDASTRDIGLVRYDLTFDAASDSFRLVGRAGPGAYRQLGTLQAAEHVWDAGADLWRSQGVARRDALLAGLDDAGAPRLWGSLQGGRVSRDWRGQDGDEVMDLDYRQTRRGGQLGYDLFGHSGDSTTLRIGLTGGYSTATLGYRNGGERSELSTANAGLYANYVGDKLFANLLVKYDLHDIALKSAAFVTTEDIGGSTWGADGEIGLRLGTSGIFAEPVIGLAWTSTSLDRLTNATQSLTFQDSDQFKARVGARFGGTSNFSGGDTLTLYASGHAVRVFGRDYALTVKSGASQRVRGERLGTYGEGRLGIAYRTTGGFETFAEGQSELGSGYEALTARAGFRIGF